MGRPSSGGHIRKFPRHNTYYRLISVTENGKRKQVFEHRLVMEKHLGRKLLPNEVIHHKDGDGLNNALENLELMEQSEHQNEHLMDGTSWDVEEAAKLRADGWTLEKIATKYGVTWGAIHAAFKRRGISTADRRERPISWDVEAAAKMLAGGASSYAVADAMGVTRPALREALKRRGMWEK